MDPSLTRRDVAAIRLIALWRLVPVELVAERYYAGIDDELEHLAPLVDACRRRLRRLARAGFVELGVEHDGRARRAVVRPGPRASVVTGGQPARRRVHARNRAHHVRTLDAIQAIEREMQRARHRVVEVRLEHDLRRLERSGKQLRVGDRLEMIPDAVVVVESPNERRLIEIAVEYVTSKYSDADIVAKRDSFARFDRTLWFADNPRTAERVRRLTSSACEVLR